MPLDGLKKLSISPKEIKARMTGADLNEEMHSLKKANITMSNQPNPLDNAVCAFV